MKTSRRLYGGLAAAAVLLTACSEDAQNSVMAPDAMSSVVETGYLDVWKFGPAGTYAFSLTESPATGAWKLPTFNVAAGSRETVWQQSDAAAPATNVTVTETPVAGIKVDSVLVRVWQGGVIRSEDRYYNVNSATAFNISNLTDIDIKFYNSTVTPPPPPPPPPGFEGCTPGYWKQSQHFDSWVGYSPTDSFSAVFGVNYPGTLLDAASANGGGANALARHAVAALLNATSSVQYGADAASVIAAVQAAFASGDYETQKNIFAGWNERGCPLN
ncbi:MAG TPA: hypothetical protein VF035_03840 [Longimicrobiales bacterium]